MTPKRYLQPSWLKAAHPSHHWARCERVLRRNPCVAVQKRQNGRTPLCDVEYWYNLVRHFGSRLFNLVIHSPPTPPQVTFKPDLSTAEVHDENIKGPLKVRQEEWRRQVSHSQPQASSFLLLLANDHFSFVSFDSAYITLIKHKRANQWSMGFAIRFWISCDFGCSAVASLPWSTSLELSLAAYEDMR